MELINNRHILVEENGKAIQDESGDWLVMDVIDKKMYFIPPTKEVLELFNILSNSEAESLEHLPEHTESVVEEQVISNKDHKENYPPAAGKWDRTAILSLISLYKDNYDLFKSTTFKNENVWNIITRKLNEQVYSYTKIQVENKFKYLKQRYLKKGDNMGTKSTGQSPVVFDYLIEFDEIFGSKPNVKPMSIASSSSCCNSESASDEPEIKKRKTSKLEHKVSNWKLDFVEREQRKEEARERRHQERMSSVQKSIDTYEKLMSKLIDKL